MLEEKKLMNFTKNKRLYSLVEIDERTDAGPTWITDGMITSNNNGVFNSVPLSNS